MMLGVGVEALTGSFLDFEFSDPNVGRFTDVVPK